MYHKAVADNRSASTVARLAKMVGGCSSSVHAQLPLPLGRVQGEERRGSRQRSSPLWSVLPLAALTFITLRVPPTFHFQVALMYEDVSRAFSVPSLANYFDKSWPVSTGASEAGMAASAQGVAPWQLVPSPSRASDALSTSNEAPLASPRHPHPFYQLRRAFEAVLAKWDPKGQFHACVSLAMPCHACVSLACALAVTTRSPEGTPAPRSHAQGHAALKASLYHVEVLSLIGKSLHEEDKIALEVSVLREAFAWLQNTKKVCALVLGARSDVGALPAWQPGGNDGLHVSFVFRSSLHSSLH